MRFPSASSVLIWTCVLWVVAFAILSIIALTLSMLGVIE